MKSCRPCWETKSDTLELQKIICRSSKIFVPLPSHPHLPNSSVGQKYVLPGEVWNSSWHSAVDRRACSWNWGFCLAENIPVLECNFAKSQNKKGKQSEITNLTGSEMGNHTWEAGLLLCNFFYQSSNPLFHSEIVLATGGGQKLWFAEPGMDTPSLGNVGSPTTGDFPFGSISNISIVKDVWTFSDIKQGYN